MLKYLNEKAAKHSKSGDLIKSEISEERYLTDKRFSLSEVQLLSKLRTRMLDVKKNSPSLWNNVLTCRICKDEIEIESQEHLLRCKEIQKHVDIPSNIKYSDIFSHVDKQIEVVRIFKKIERQREILLNCLV